MAVVLREGSAAELPAVLELLALSFPPAELVSAAELETAVSAGTALVTIACASDGRLLGATVVDLYVGCRVALLSYLAVHSASRGTGVGSLLCGALDARFRERGDTDLVVAEIEHAGGPPAAASYGDPVRRIRFYERMGYRVLDLPYFQPALSAEGERVYAMMLAVAYADPGLFDATAARLVRTDALRCFLRMNLHDGAGEVGDQDPAAAALLEAADDPAGIAVVPMARAGTVRRSAPPKGGTSVGRDAGVTA